ncbi:ornithine cyclodeaminase family protein [Phenylobacterium sp.]|uniref:ornithine cyclodeaminase family protein n=1 Tax=Phenylobacterium sp. TaxID=1871053 RepID=UPI002FDA2C3A
MAQSIGGLDIWSAEAVREALTPAAALPVVRQAMIDLSAGRVRQLLRSFIGLGEGRTFAIMPAALEQPAVFGAKLVSVFHDGTGRKAHEGLVVLFDGESGAPVCLADAGEVTAIRTAAASAAATDALALPEARVLTILGGGRQAQEHVRALSLVRDFTDIRIWSRQGAQSRALADSLAVATGLPVRAAEEARDAVADAQVICTVTAAADPILFGEWVAPGTHVNLVGSSGPAQAEADTDLVARSRYIVDHREHVLAHGGEFLRARQAGRIDEAHIAAEIGQVFSGAVPGRADPDEVTLYKSLGHAVQDLACVAWLNGRAR